MKYYVTKHTDGRWKVWHVGLPCRSVIDSDHADQESAEQERRRMENSRSEEADPFALN